MLKLSTADHAQLASQRFEAPIIEALQRAMASLGARPESASIDRGSFEGFELQTRSAFALAKDMRCSPAKAAMALADALDSELGALGRAERSGGTGFVNIRLSDAFLMGSCSLELGVFPRAPWLRALVDYSSPNCAKRMHVGHLRSSVIGDALCRIMLACGADVERVNHLGDWGTPFGVIIEQARDEGALLERADLASIEALYQRGSSRTRSGAQTPDANLGPSERAGFDSRRADGAAFAQRARETTAQMQRLEEPALGAWKAIRSSALDQLQEIYSLLDIGLEPRHAIGESAYQEEATALLERLVADGLCVSGPQGVAFTGAPTPLPLGKSADHGGGLLYGGTDAAALARRGPTGRKLLYVTDERQAGHFNALFELGLRAGWTQPGQALHVPFGMMLAADGAPFQSRKGGALPLSELIEDALEAARAVARSKTPEASGAEIDAVAAPIGIGALKYGDLSRNRSSAVKFDIERAVSLEGDTAPYLQYARVRALSAASRAESFPSSARRSDSVLNERERDLAWSLCRLRGAACDALEALEPHRLCQALYEASRAFGSFYEHCPCESDGLHDPVRLLLARSFAARSGQVLESLGIRALDSMPRSDHRHIPVKRLP